MALKKLRGLKVGRLLVIIMIFAIPIFFYLLIIGSLRGWFAEPILEADMFVFLGTTGLKFLPYWLSWTLVWLGIPFFFSLPWWIFLFIDRNRVGETFDNMGRALRKVSLGLNIFYSINTLIIFVFFLLPFGSPAITVFASLGIIPWAIRKKTGAKLPWWVLIIPSLALAAFPIIISIGFYARYASIWGSIWSLWSGGAITGTLIAKFGMVHVLYGFGYSVAVGAVLAGFASFIYEGASQVDRNARKPKGLLYIVEFIVATGVFVTYMLLPVETDARKYTFIAIGALAIGIGLLEFIIRFFKKIKRTERDSVPIAAYVMLPIFIGVDFVRLGKFGADTTMIHSSVLTASLALACLVYFVLFVMAYSFAGETYKSRWSKGYGDDEDDDDDEDTSDED